jgi:hypothetical protein
MRAFHCLFGLALLTGALCGCGTMNRNDAADREAYPGGRLIVEPAGASNPGGSFSPHSFGTSEPHPEGPTRQ